MTAPDRRAVLGGIAAMAVAGKGRSLSAQNTMPPAPSIGTIFGAASSGEEGAGGARPFMVRERVYSLADKPREFHLSDDARLICLKGGKVEIRTWPGFEPVSSFFSVSSLSDIAAFRPDGASVVTLPSIYTGPPASVGRRLRGLAQAFDVRTGESIARLDLSDLRGAKAHPFTESIHRIPGTNLAVFVLSWLGSVVPPRFTEFAVVDLEAWHVEYVASPSYAQTRSRICAMNASGLIATGYHVRNRPDVPSDGSSRERYVDVFDARTGSLVSRLDMEAHAAGTAAWSPDGSVLAVGLHDPRRFTLGANGNRTYIPPEDALRLWRGGLGERLPVQFEDARGGVDRIEISDDNRHVLAVMRYPDGTDGTGVSIWEIATGRRVVSAFPASPGSIGGVFSGQLPNIPVAKFLPGGRHVAWIKHVAVGSSVLEVFRIV